MRKWLFIRMGMFHIKHMSGVPCFQFMIASITTMNHREMSSRRFENNVILTQTERLMMSGRPKHPKYARNKNVIVIGGSGSGKTRFYVKPNLMQMPEKVSYVLTDPNGKN